MLTLKLLAFVAFIGSVAWFMHAPDYEPAVASIAALSALIATFVTDQKRKNAGSMRQSVGSGAVGIQAGGNVTTGNINTKTTDK